MAYTLRAVSPQAEKKRLELIAYISPDIPSILKGDPDRIRQILLNLLMNAIKFTDSGQIVLRLDPVKTELPYLNLIFSVQDTGRGVPKSAQARLFQPYVQLDPSSVRTQGGVGLGLTITKHLVGLMQGECGVQSDGMHGSTFWFRIRLERSSNKREADWEPNRSLQRRRLLVVDDNQKVCEAIKAQTEYWAMPTDTAERGSQALEKLVSATAQGMPYWALLIDAQLMDIDVVELLTRIRKQAELAATVIIVMHTSKFKATAQSELRMFADGALSKPVEIPQLASTLVALLNRVSLIEDISEDHSHMNVEENVQTQPAWHLLVADDNSVTQEILDYMLKKQGCLVDIVSDGAAAVAAAAQAEYDLILMDCQMPGMSGYEAAIKILEQQGDQCPPIIAMTANALASDREYCLQLGMSDYLAKPLTSEKIKNTLQRWTPVIRGMRRSAPAESLRTLPIPGNVLDREIWRAYLETAAHSGDRAFIEQIVNLFIDDTQDRLRKLREIAASGQQAAFAKAVHALAGGCRHIGAARMHKLCKSLEDHAAKSNLSDLQKSTDALDAEFSAATAALKSMIELERTHHRQQNFAAH